MMGQIEWKQKLIAAVIIITAMVVMWIIVIGILSLEVRYVDWIIVILKGMLVLSSIYISYVFVSAIIAVIRKDKRQ